MEVRLKERQTYSQTERKAERHIDSQDREIGSLVDGQSKRYKDRQIKDIYTDRQTDRLRARYKVLQIKNKNDKLLETW